MTAMRAKVRVTQVTPYGASEKVDYMPVCGPDAFGPNGESEDNTYARYTPSGFLTLTITNPALIGTITVGDRFYVDFTPVPDGK